MTFSWLGTGIRLAAATTAILASSIAAGATLPAASDAGARMLRLSENVYVIDHDDATDEWPHGNTGVIVGTHGPLRDRFLLPALAREGRHRPHPPRDRQAGALSHDDALAFRPQQRRHRLPGSISRRDADRRAQHRALDRAQPELLEGALDRAGLRAACCAREARGGARPRRGRGWQALQRGRAREARGRDREAAQRARRARGA